LCGGAIGRASDLRFSVIIYSYSEYIKEKKNVKPQTVQRNSINEHASAVEK